MTRWTWRLPRYGLPPSTSGLEPRRNVSGPGSACDGRAGSSAISSAAFDRVAPGRQLVDLALAVQTRNGTSEPTVICPRPSAQQDAHRGGARLDELRARVVVGEDLLVRNAALRLAVRAPLAHADAVPPAATADDERRRGDRVLGAAVSSRPRLRPPRATAGRAAADLRARSIWAGASKETQQASGTVLASDAVFIASVRREAYCCS